MKRTAAASWKGSVRIGEGTVSTGSGVLSNMIFVTGSNAGEVPSTTCTEMLAATESACMSVTLARELESAGVPFESIHTEAEINVEFPHKTPEITGILLNVTVQTVDGEPAAIEKAVNRAKHHGVVTKVLKCDVKVKTHIVSSAHA
jgi:osmotically inducible protein OsmC